MLDTVLNTLLVFSKTALSRSSRSQMFLECSKNFATLTRKHLCCSLFLIKLQASRHVTLLKRDSNAGVFLWSFYEHLFFTEHLRWLLLTFWIQYIVSILLYPQRSQSTQSSCSSISPIVVRQLANTAKH